MRSERSWFGRGGARDHAAAHFRPVTLCAGVGENTQRKQMMWMLRQATKPFKKCSAAAHGANANEVADDEPRDLDRDLEQNTTGTNPKDPDEQERSSQDANSNPLLRQRTARRPGR